MLPSSPSPCWNNKHYFLFFTYFYPTFYLFLFLSLIYWLCFYSRPILFSPLYPPPPSTPIPSSIPPALSSCPCHTRKFFGFSISYTILTLPLSILYLTITLLMPCTFSPIPPSADNPPCDLHFFDSVPVLVVCLVYFCFCSLGSVVDTAEFVVIWLFIVLSFFSLGKSL